LFGLFLLFATADKWFIFLILLDLFGKGGIFIIERLG